jgi:FMN-dependent dehydrogenase
MPPESRGRMGLFRRLLDQRHAGSTPRWAETVSRCLTIDDLRQLMEHRVPPVVTDYFLGGAGSEQTMRDNVEAFARARFNPHYGVKHTEIDLATTLLGHTISMPIIAAPVGSLRTLWPREKRWRHGPSETPERSAASRPSPAPLSKRFGPPRRGRVGFSST